MLFTSGWDKDCKITNEITKQASLSYFPKVSQWSDADLGNSHYVPISASDLMPILWEMMEEKLPTLVGISSQRGSAGIAEQSCRTKGLDEEKTIYYRWNVLYFSSRLQNPVIYIRTENASMPLRITEALKVLIISNTCLINL